MPTKSNKVTLQKNFSWIDIIYIYIYISYNSERKLLLFDGMSMKLNFSFHSIYG